MKNKWYQNSIVWLIISLPLAAVAGSAALIYFSVVGADKPIEQQELSQQVSISYLESGRHQRDDLSIR